MLNLCSFVYRPWMPEDFELVIEVYHLVCVCGVHLQECTCTKSI